MEMGCQTFCAGQRSSETTGPASGLLQMSQLLRLAAASVDEAHLCCVHYCTLKYRSRRAVRKCNGRAADLSNSHTIHSPGGRRKFRYREKLVASDDKHIEGSNP